MRTLRELRGLRFPDPYVVRHFFKSGADRRTGRVLDLGCGSGNNLQPYAAWSWTGTGIDHDPRQIAFARHNLGDEFDFVLADLADGFPVQPRPYDSAIVANLLCYLSAAEGAALLGSLRDCLVPSATFLLRTRLTGDGRHGQGTEVCDHTYRMPDGDGDEGGLTIYFYTVTNLLHRINQAGLAADAVLEVKFDNLQEGKVVKNHDVVVWGTRV